MDEKEVFRPVCTAVVFFALVLLSGCVLFEEKASCGSGMVLIDGTCCFDDDGDGVCDSEFCGDGECQEDENCSTCWQDCGACKKIIYRYVPRNYTLRELTDDLDGFFAKDVKFRKDIVVDSPTSRFFYFESMLPRVLGFFMSIDYRLLSRSRLILLNNIVAENFYVNSTDSFLKYLNRTRWYRIHRIVNSEQSIYTERITSESSLDDYPAPPTGHEKEFRYSDWEFRNFTLDKEIIIDNTSVLEEGIVEDVYASLFNYDVRYKYHEYQTTECGEDDDECEILEAYKIVEEKGFSYIHSMNILCSEDLVITLYNYDYDDDEFTGRYFNIQFDRNRESLLKQARKIRSVCTNKYSDERFTYS